MTLDYQQQQQQQQIDVQITTRGKRSNNNKIEKLIILQTYQKRIVKNSFVN